MIVAFACFRTLIMFKCSEFGIVPNLLEIVNHNANHNIFPVQNDNTQFCDFMWLVSQTCRYCE